MSFGWRASISVYPFPDPKKAGKEGLLAVGGDLSPMRLLSAYSQGIFPWYSEDDPIMWWSPDPRMILLPVEMNVSASLRQIIRKADYEFRMDIDFATVIEKCSDVPRSHEDGTWITTQMKEAYIGLHELGFAHSAEIRMEGELVGGLYGISIGKAFFGESMFHERSNASKLAFYHLTEILRSRGFHFIDCQMTTEHLASLGAREIPREEFLALLKANMDEDDTVGSWSSWAL